MTDLEREILLDDRNKKRQLLMEKYELIKQARELQKNKDLVNQFLILFDNSYF